MARQRLAGPALAIGDLIWLNQHLALPGLLAQQCNRRGYKALQLAAPAAAAAAVCKFSCAAAGLQHSV